MTLKPNRNRFAGSCAIGTVALALEVLGVSSGAYYYNSAFLVKLWGVPISIVAMWVGVALFAYYVSTKIGVVGGVFIAYSIDLILEPLAYYTGLWTWADTYTAQIYFGSTLGNLAVWLGMCYFGVRIYRTRLRDTY